MAIPRHVLEASQVLIGAFNARTQLNLQMAQATAEMDARERTLKMQEQELEHRKAVSELQDQASKLRAQNDKARLQITAMNAQTAQVNARTAASNAAVGAATKLGKGLGALLGITGKEQKTPSQRAATESGARRSKRDDDIYMTDQVWRYSNPKYTIEDAKNAKNVDAQAWALYRGYDLEKIQRSRDSLKSSMNNPAITLMWTAEDRARNTRDLQLLETEIGNRTSFLDDTLGPTYGDEMGQVSEALVGAAPGTTAGMKLEVSPDVIRNIVDMAGKNPATVAGAIRKLKLDAKDRGSDVSPALKQITAALGGSLSPEIRAALEE